MEAQLKGRLGFRQRTRRTFTTRTSSVRSPEQVRASHILILSRKAPSPRRCRKEEGCGGDRRGVKKGEAFDKLAKELSDPSAKRTAATSISSPRSRCAQFSGGLRHEDESSGPVRASLVITSSATDRKDAGRCRWKTPNPSHRLSSARKSSRRWKDL
jgi:hypothetical protein